MGGEMDAAAVLWLMQPEAPYLPDFADTLGRPEWMSQGACRLLGPGAFFGGGSGDLGPARGLCAACPSPRNVSTTPWLGRTLWASGAAPPRGSASGAGGELGSRPTPATRPRRPRRSPRPRRPTPGPTCSTPAHPCGDHSAWWKRPLLCHRGRLSPWPTTRPRRSSSSPGGASAWSVTAVTIATREASAMVGQPSCSDEGPAAQEGLSPRDQLAIARRLARYSSTSSGVYQRPRGVRSRRRGSSAQPSPAAGARTHSSRGTTSVRGPQRPGPGARA